MTNFWIWACLTFGGYALAFFGLFEAHTIAVGSLFASAALSLQYLFGPQA